VSLRIRLKMKVNYETECFHSGLNLVNPPDQKKMKTREIPSKHS